MYNFYIMDLKQINNTSITAANISIGDKIPVGGTMPGAFNLSLEIDKIPDELADAFKKMHENAARINTPAYVKWLHDIGTNIPPDVFAHLFAFSRVFNTMFPSVAASPDMYIARGAEFSESNTAQLSNLFHKNLFQCTEFAIVAQLYLQTTGIDSKYVGGEFLSSPTVEFGDSHSWNEIHTENGEFIFDPANPMYTNVGIMPNISRIKLNSKQMVQLRSMLMKNRRVAYFPVENILTHHTAYYGYGDGASVFPELVISALDINTVHVKKSLMRE